MIADLMWGFTLENASKDFRVKATLVQLSWGSLLHNTCTWTWWLIIHPSIVLTRCWYKVRCQGSPEIYKLHYISEISWHLGQLSIILGGATSKFLPFFNTLPRKNLLQHWNFACPIGHGNQDHETSSNRGRFERFTTYLSKPDLDRLLNKALQAPSVGGGCVIPITVPYWHGGR